ILAPELLPVFAQAGLVLPEASRRPLEVLTAEGVDEPAKGGVFLVVGSHVVEVRPEVWVIGVLCPAVELEGHLVVAVAPEDRLRLGDLALADRAGLARGPLWRNPLSHLHADTAQAVAHEDAAAARPRGDPPHDRFELGPLKAGSVAASQADPQNASIE